MIVHYPRISFGTGLSVVDMCNGCSNYAMLYILYSLHYVGLVPSKASCKTSHNQYKDLPFVGKLTVVS